MRSQLTATFAALAIADARCPAIAYAMAGQWAIEVVRDLDGSRSLVAPPGQARWQRES